MCIRDRSGRVILAHAFRSVIGKGEPVFGEVFISSSHRKSLMAVRAGRADIAAVDGVTFSLLEKHQPSLLEGLTIVGVTDWAPALPLVTKAGASAETIERLRLALDEVLADPGLEDVKEALLIRGWVPTDLRAYRRSRALAAEARAVQLSEDAPALHPA